MFLSGIFDKDLYTFDKDDWDMAEMIDNFKSLLSRKEEDRELVFFCIGSDKCIADCFGPLLGTLIGKEYIVYGTLGSTVNGTNLNKILKEVKEKHNNPFIVAVDSCVGKSKNVGRLVMRQGSIQPGIGVGKDHLDEVGDVAITLTTAETNLFKTLPQNVPLGSIYHRAEKVAFMIKSSI